LRENVMPDPRSLQIESLRAQLAEAEARLAADEQTRLSEELQPEPAFDFFAQPEPAPEPEPEPVSMYDVPQDPAEALAGVLPSSHEVGGFAGLGAGVAN
jgi:hypothetical protein